MTVRQDNALRVPPRDELAEVALLGASWYSREALEVLATETQPDDFAPGTHQALAAALTKAYVEGFAVDNATILPEMARLGASHVTTDDLQALVFNAPTSKGAPRWAQQIKQATHQRRLIALGVELTDAGYTGDDIGKILAEVQALQIDGAHNDDLPYAEQIRRHLIFGDDIDRVPPSQPLIEGILDIDTLAVLYGRSGHGKTFVAVDWALSVSTGTWWQRHMVRPGRSLYVISEGVAGMGARKRAWQEQQRVHIAGEITWLTYPPNLFKDGWALALAQYAAELQPSLIVVDTLARSMIGADENSAKDMGIVVAGADRVRRASGACVLLVHHTGKNEAAGMRGHSALEAAVDAAIECRLTDEGAVEIVTAKQKDRPSGEKVQLRMVPVGTTGSVALAEWRGSTEPDELPAQAVDLLAVLAEMDMGDGVASSPWLSTSKMQQRSYHRWRKRFLELGLVFEVKKGKFQLSARGARVAAGGPLHGEVAPDVHADDEF